MTHTTSILVRLDPKVKKALQAIKDRDGVPYQQQITRAIARWLEEQAQDKRGAK